MPYPRDPGRSAVRVQLLPTTVDRLPTARGGPTAVAIGIGESDLGTVAIDFAESAHLMVLGDSGCGKTAALRALCVQLIRTCSPEAVQLYLVDVRRTLLGVVESAHLAGYAISADVLAAQLRGLVELLRARRPSASVTQQQLRERSWWSGPEIYVLVDDYDLLAAGATDPLTPLLEFLPHARDLGLHLVLARRAGGAARAMFNPVPAAVRELGGAGLVMSAGAEDGTLWGSCRPTALPPGRATLVTRGRPEERVQLLWTEPP